MTIEIVIATDQDPEVQSEDEDRDRDKEIVMAKKIVNLRDQEAENLEMTTNKLIRRRLIY